MWLGVISLVELFAAAALIFVWAGPLLFRALDDEWWQQLAAILALAAVAVSVLVVLFLPRLLAAPGARGAALHADPGGGPQNARPPLVTRISPVV